MSCSHPRRRQVTYDCGTYIAVMIYCSVCGVFITQENKYKDQTDYDRGYRNPRINDDD